MGSAWQFLPQRNNQLCRRHRILLPARLQHKLLRSRRLQQLCGAERATRCHTGGGELHGGLDCAGLQRKRSRPSTAATALTTINGCA